MALRDQLRTPKKSRVIKNKTYRKRYVKKVQSRFSVIRSWIFFGSHRYCYILFCKLMYKKENKNNFYDCLAGSGQSKLYFIRL